MPFRYPSMKSIQLSHSSNKMKLGIPTEHQEYPPIMRGDHLPWWKSSKVPHFSNGILTRRTETWIPKF
ncbi:unnamed protein product, partial [Cyprideis torosa]